jgi:prevent-host-death family protein
MDDQSGSSVKKINAMKARQNFGQLLEQVYYRGEIYIVERAGKPMAALVPLSHLEELQKQPGPTKNEHNMLKGKQRQSRTGKA